MIYVIVGGLCVGLVGCFWYIIYLKRNMNATYINMEKRFETFRQEDNEKWKNEMNQERNSYQKKINSLNSAIENLTDNINNLQKYSRNTGEIVTHQLLTDVKTNMIQDNLISQEEMLILPNLFIPDDRKRGLQTRQIDHLVLLPTGIYIVETKYWRGKIVHGLSNDHSGLFSFIPKMISNDNRSSNKTHTLVFNPNQESNGSVINIKSYGNPEEQVMNTAMTLRRYIYQQFQHKMFITPIVYFGYPYTQKEIEGVTDLSENKNVSRLVGEQQLSKYFQNQLQKEKRRHSINDIRKIKDNLENTNYIDT